MRAGIRAAVFLIGVIFIIPSFAQTDVNVGATFGSEGLKNFYLSISQYYQVPEKEVVVIRERKIPEEELPVVFFIAGKAEVKPEVIVNLRLGGSSWYDISVKYGIFPEEYYVPLETYPGPPYGKAYGYFINKPKNEWKTIRLTDTDIINLVNLRFISEHFNYKPERVIKMRGKGKHYVVINDEFKAEKEGHKKHSKRKGKNKEK